MTIRKIDADPIADAMLPIAQMYGSKLSKFLRRALYRR